MTSTDSATLDPVTTTAPRANFYVRAWRRLPRDLGYLALTAVLLPTAYALLYALFWGGIGSIAAIIGIFLVLAALYAARFLGRIELVRIHWAEPRDIRQVNWKHGTGQNAFFRIFSALGEPHYWLFLLHALLLLPVVGILTTSVTLSWITAALAAVFYPAYRSMLPDNVHLQIPWNRAAAFFRVDEAVIVAISVIVGLLLLALLPLLTRTFVRLHFQLDRLLLGGFRSRDLEKEVADLSASRSAAVSAEGTALRRLERDIHDGPQQRLVRLQMDLAAADRQLTDHPDAARTLIAEAMGQSKEALEELRALSRGFAPPILLDRGLVAALESLTVRSTVPVTLSTELPTPVLLPQEIERNTYFVASELLTNVAKHAAATTISLRVALSADASELQLTVTDDGVGGAAIVIDHGLAGLDERLRGLGGQLRVDSPVGGPTVITALLPVV
jgi:signal transduction histidine kinase